MSKQIDKRIKNKHISISAFLWTFFTLAFFTSIQLFILKDYLNIKDITAPYYVYMVGYWLISCTILILVTHIQLKTFYERPMKRLADASRKVANGDFSVYVKPIHTADKTDFIDVMIMDFNKMVEELGSMETLKSELLGNVSHEIKTPLSIISNLAQILQDESLSEEKRKEYSDTLLLTTRKLSDLITNILKLNKLENQSIHPVYKKFDIGVHLCEQILTFENLWEEKELEVIADIEENVFVESDPDLLTLVWNNLLSNAIKFSNPESKIYISLKQEEEMVAICFKDEGCGMREETMQKIFDKFYQGDTSHTTNGNGLGLSLVKRILQLIHGQIEVESKIQEGSSFTVTLKAIQKEEELNGE